MADIFISYSRKDSAHAHALADAMRARGLTVWVDVSGIEAATSWSQEIVDAIDSCKVFLVLLSERSITSDNVVRELSLAYESQRPILPVDIEPVPLPSKLRYQLAGVQRAAIEDVESIARALERLGVQSQPSTPLAHITHGSSRRAGEILRLAVLPFDDLSPAKDNEWFADGMMDELINTLGALGGLHVNPRTDVNYYKGKRPKLDELALDLKCRYVVEGAVQKVGEKIRVRVSLSDAIEHSQIWGQKYDGTFEDIFDFQEKTSLAIAEALRLRLAPEDKERIERKPTESLEAYELYLRAMFYDNRNTKLDNEHAIHLGEQAVALDPDFSLALGCLGYSYLSRFRNYDRSPKWLELADEMIHRSLSLKPHDAHTHSMLGILHLNRGEAEEAVRFARKGVDLDPENWIRWFHLGFIYMALDQAANAAAAYETAVSLEPKSVPSHFNLAIMYDRLDNLEKRKEAAIRGIDFIKEHLTRNPDDQSTRLNYTVLLLFADRIDECLAETEYILRMPTVDSNVYYNSACIFMAVGQHERAMSLLEKAVEGGFMNFELLRGTIGQPEFQADGALSARSKALLYRVESLAASANGTLQ